MKIDLEQQELNALATLGTRGGADVEALKKVFRAAEAELRDVMNIDPKGNMGLQSLASQRAVEMLWEIGDVIFPAGSGKTTAERKKISPWR